MANIVGDIAVMPRVKGAEGIGDMVALAVGVIRSSGLKYEVDAMSTSVEGEFDDVMELFKRVHRVVMDAGADRVVTIMRVDEKRGGVTMDEKLSGLR